MAVSVQSSQKRKLRLNPPLTFQGVLVGKLDMPVGEVAVAYGLHRQN